MNLIRRTDNEAQNRPKGARSIEDHLNAQIVKMLETDGRMAFSEIAQKLNVSEGTIRNRVNAMKDAGLLRIVAIADPSTSEYSADAMIGVKTAPGVTPQAVADRLGAASCVIYILWVTGRYDLMVEIVCDHNNDLTSFLETHIHSADDIVNAEVMLGLKNFKNQFLLKRNWEDG